MSLRYKVRQVGKEDKIAETDQPLVFRRGEVPTDLTLDEVKRMCDLWLAGAIHSAWQGVGKGEEMLIIFDKREIEQG